MSVHLQQQPKHEGGRLWLTRSTNREIPLLWHLRLQVHFRGLCWPQPSMRALHPFQGLPTLSWGDPFTGPVPTAPLSCSSVHWARELAAIVNTRNMWERRKSSSQHTPLSYSNKICLGETPIGAIALSSETPWGEGASGWRGSLKDVDTGAWVGGANSDSPMGENSLQSS